MTASGWFLLSHRRHRDARQAGPKLLAPDPRASAKDGEPGVTVEMIGLTKCGANDSTIL